MLVRNLRTNIMNKVIYIDHSVLIRLKIVC